MKKYLLSLLFVCILLSTFSLAGCKKDKDSKTIPEMLLGKWTLVKIAYAELYDGVPYDSTEMADEGSYFQFNEDGTLTGYIDTDYNGNWEYNDNKLLLSKNNNAPTPFDIQTLTSTDCVLYNKETDGDNYSETTVYLER